MDIGEHILDLWGIFLADINVSNHWSLHLEFNSDSITLQ